MKGNTKQSERHVEAVLAAMDILDCFLSDSPLGTKDIVARTGLTRNRVMRLSGTLLSREYLLYDETHYKYTPGPRLMALGKVYEQQNDLISIGRPFLRKLVEKTGESACIYVRNGLKRMVLAREEGTHSIRYTSREGQILELYTGAGGKTLLAFGPEEIRRHFTQSAQLKTHTETTIADPAVLAKELDQISQRGYATSFGERVPDSAAVTAPVFNYEDKLVAAIGVVGPTSRLRKYAQSQYLKHVLNAAQLLSLQLGCRISNQKEP